MACRGLYFDELDRIVNVRNAQISASAKGNAEKQTIRKKKSKAVYVKRIP
jgi:hypothetical protein